MVLDRLVQELAKVFVASTVLVCCRKGRMTADTFRRLVRQRHQNASRFVPLLEAGIAAAKRGGQPKLASVFERNWRDETGINLSGECRLVRSHATWRDWYLVALGMTQKPSPAWYGTAHYEAMVERLIAGGDCFEIAGALLLLEAAIPLEFEALVVARDQLFPEAFVASPNATADTHATIERARLYLDDHIRHDRTYHYPDLLRALECIAADEAVMVRVMHGVHHAFVAKCIFYASAAIELGLG